MSANDVQIIEYRFPLRPDLQVAIWLPVGLNADDAQRLAKFVKSLAFTPGEEAWRHHCGRLNEGPGNVNDPMLGCEGCHANPTSPAEVEARYRLVEVEESGDDAA